MKFKKVITMRKKIPITIKRSKSLAILRSLAKGLKIEGKRVAMIKAMNIRSHPIRAYSSKYPLL